MWKFFYAVYWFFRDIGCIWRMRGCGFRWWGCIDCSWAVARLCAEMADERRRDKRRPKARAGVTL